MFYVKRLFKSCIYSFVLVVVALPCVAMETILTVRPDSASDTRYEYPELMLKKIVEVTRDDFGPAKVEHAASSMSRDRLLKELADGQVIHVMAEAPKAVWVNALKPIYIPIRKGVQGYRVFLIDRESQAQLSKINTLEELKQIKTGAGAQWSTAKVLRDSGFNLVTGRKFDGLFWMLMGGRFITFGRGINEAPVELAARKDVFPNMVIETDLALYLPLPTFFFVSPNKPQLAQRIEIGLIRMIESGEFDQIFYSYHLKMIEDAKLGTRKIFNVNNPTLPDAVPFDTRKYWYKPGDEKNRS